MATLRRTLLIVTNPCFGDGGLNVTGTDKAASYATAYAQTAPASGSSGNNRPNYFTILSWGLLRGAGGSSSGEGEDAALSDGASTISPLTSSTAKERP